MRREGCARSAGSNADKGKIQRARKIARCFLLLSFIGVSGCVTVARFKKLEDRVDQIDSQLSTLSRRADQMNSQLSKLSEHAAQLDSQFSTLSRRTDQMNSELSKLSERAAQLDSQLSTLSRRADQMNSQLSTLSQGVQEMALRLSELSEEVGSLKTTKADATEVKACFDEIRKRLDGVQYRVDCLEQESLIPVSTGYRNAVRSARGTAVEMVPVIGKTIIKKGGQVAVFIRDFRTTDDQVSVLGDLLSREFAKYLKIRTGAEKIYREKDVIRLYQQKKLKVPAKEALNLENLEKGGFPTKSVVIISGRITPTSQAFRLDVEAIDLRDPEFQASASRLIPRDNDVDEMNKKLIGSGPQEAETER